MDYERFFHFGNDEKRAIWYLLSASCAIPQRLLCVKEYAEQKKWKTFGQYTYTSPVTERTQHYVYVIQNLFDVPYLELKNFYVSCAVNIPKSSEDNLTMANNTFNKDMVRSFNQAESYSHIDLLTKQTDLATDYLCGVDTYTNMDLNMKMNVATCIGGGDQRNVISCKRRIIKDTNDDTNTGKRASVVGDSSSGGGVSSGAKRKIIAPRSSILPKQQQQPPPLQQQPPPRTIIEEIQNIIVDTSSGMQLEDEDEDMEYISSTPQPQPEPPLSLSVETASFPSVKQPPPLTMSDIQIDYIKLRELGNFIKQFQSENWFASIINRRAEIYQSNILCFMNKNYEGYVGEIDAKQRVILNDATLERFNAYTQAHGDAHLAYPTFCSNNNESRYKLEFGPFEDQDFERFFDLVKERGPTIKEIVESPTDEEFEARIAQSNNNMYWLLYGLYKFMKQPPAYTILMAIFTTTFYSDNRILTLFSDLYIRIYFTYMGQIGGQIGGNNRFATNLSHFKNIFKPNDTIDGVIESKDKQRAMEKLIPKIRNSPLNFSVDENGIIREGAYFGLNLFPIDEYLFYIVENGNAYVFAANFMQPHDLKNLKRYKSAEFDIFVNLNFRGVAHKYKEPLKTI